MTSTDAEEDHPRRRASSQLLLEQIATIGAIGLGLFALVKTYAVAHYSLTTAAALLTAAPFAILLGSLTSYEYEFFPLLGLFALCWAIALWRREGFTALAGGLLGLAVLSLLISPLVYLLIFAGVLGLFWALHVRAVGWAASGRWAPRSTILETDDDPPPEPVRATRWAAEQGVNFLTSSRRTLTLAFVLGVVWVVGSTLGNAWLPAEVITFSSAPSATAATSTSAAADQNRVVGYVVSSDEDWTTIMRAGDRGLIRERTDAVTGRVICHLTGAQPAGHKPILYGTQTYRSPNRSCLHVLQSMDDAPLLCGSLSDDETAPMIAADGRKLPCQRE